MALERGATDPFAAEIDALYMSGGSLATINANEALDGKVLVPRLKALAPGDTLYLVTGDGSALEPYDHAHVSKIGALAKTREQAMSGIFFGQLSLTGEDGGENTQMVAVKPVGPEWFAAQEYAMARTVNSAGVTNVDASANQPVTFDPVGFHRLQSGRMAVLTAFEQGVKSFDNYLWVPPDRRPTERIIQWALGNAAATLIFLHANALVHNDYQVKNTAVDPDGSRVIDITGMSKVGGIGIDAATKYVGDLDVYIGSLNDSARDHGVDPYVTEEQVREFFIGPYADCTEDMFGRRAGLKPIIDYQLSSRDITGRL